MACNVELKARLADPAAARAIAAGLTGGLTALLEQTDTYFRVPRGRLKLRETAGAEAQLVAYLRADEAAARTSDYLLTPVSEPARLKESLARTCGVLVVVRKRRELFLYRNVRIHLDEVFDLGWFLELEAVLSSGATGAAIDEPKGREQVRWLCEAFGVVGDAVERGSYADLLNQSG